MLAPFSAQAVMEAKLPSSLSVASGIVSRLSACFVSFPMKDFLDGPISIG